MALAPAALAPPPSTPSPSGPIAFGVPLRAATDIDFGQLLAQPDKYTSGEVTVKGVVRQVCQMRGCWLELATDTAPEAAGCRVISQGHAFFVPIDSAGKQARVQGKLEVRDVPAAQVAHMEHEGGRFANKQPDGSAKELRIVATGVELASRAR